MKQSSPKLRALTRVEREKNIGGKKRENQEQDEVVNKFEESEKRTESTEKMQEVHQKETNSSSQNSQMEISQGSICQQEERQTVE